MKLQIQAFRGIAPRVNPRYLADGLAQVASNVRTEGDSLDAIRAPSATVHSLPHAGEIKTIYKFGEDITNDTQHWFAFSGDVDVCRGQIADDPSEWTFYTGVGAPKATYNGIALGVYPPSGSLPLGLPAPSSALNVAVSTPEPEGGEDATAAEIKVPTSILSQLTASTTYSIQTAGSAKHTGSFASAPTGHSLAASINDQPLPVVATYEAGGVSIRTTSTGAGAFVRFAMTSPNFQADAYGTDAVEPPAPPPPQYRVYVYTYINTVASLTMESAASPASEIAEVQDDSTVTISGFSLPGGGYTVTGVRLYRAVDGSYLFVDEIAVGKIASGYTDDKQAEELGELLPSLEWDMPPDDMRGLINLPNGLMAGFSGRDICFCDPYRPYAWPTSYRQTVDYPVVALGRMDTTLAVLTKGNPYFIQGSDPNVMTAVKADIEQACVAKRSVASIDGAVYYVCPDGLMKLSSSGSGLVTEALFDARSWSAMIDLDAPIQAYVHDRRYIAFCRFNSTAFVGNLLGGFVFDAKSGEFYLHDQYSECAFSDLRQDKLFVARDRNQLRIWEAGAALTGQWRSKTFSLPRETSFSTLQVEAEAYSGLTVEVFCDGVSVFGGPLSLTSRMPVRLPVFVGRDWEIALVTSHEVFNVILAQSMEEVANG